MSPPPSEHVMVAPSTTRPGCYRVRLLGGGGGELVVTQEQLEELVARGGEALSGPRRKTA